MADKQIIVDINAHQTRVALLEEGNLAEIYIERRGTERIVGNIYVGKVQNVLPGMQAAFVDIGLKKNAYLYAGDILADKSDLEFSDQAQKPEITAKIQDAVKPGQHIMLQILKEPIMNKGARVTTNITLPSRTMVLMPTVNYTGVSRRIEDENERLRLREIADKIKPENMGLIVRTAAQGKEEEELSGDVDFLVRMWERVRNKAQYAQPPKLIHGEEALLFRVIRDFFTEDVDCLVINDTDAYEKVKIVAEILSPKFVDRVQLYQGYGDLFDNYDIDGRIDDLMNRKVWLKSGGYIIIDQTEALTAIDVNTGKYIGSNDLAQTLFNTNLEAADEIARQLRLRDIGGIIVIDFIDMESMQDRETLLERLRTALHKDRTKTNVVGMTGLGLIEMTRKKVRNSLSATQQCSCPYCQGEGRIPNYETTALKIRKQLMREFDNSSMENWLVCVQPAVAKLFSERAQEGRTILDKLGGRTVYISPDYTQKVGEFSIRPIGDLTEVQSIIEGCNCYHM